MPTTEDKAIIGISWIGNKSDGDSSIYTRAYGAFFQAVEKCGATPVALPRFDTADEAAKALKKVDAVIMTGGTDVDPSLYGEAKSKHSGNTDFIRDMSDMVLLDAVLEEDMPLLAICRGMQILNVHQGGTLMDIPNDCTEIPGIGDAHRDSALNKFVFHDVTIEKDSILADNLKVESCQVNSWHHQAVDTVGDGLIITARADDGIIEGLEMPDKKYVVAVQFHPEWMLVVGIDEMQAIFKHFFEASKR